LHTPPSNKYRKNKNKEYVVYVIKVGKYLVKITHKQKIIFPKSGITKNELINYYYKIAPVMLPYLKNRPITMRRFVSGINEPGFYQKNIADYFPDWIDRIPIKKQDGGIVNYVVCNNAATLVYLANQLCITPHIWLSKTDKLDYPDKMIFDLDPSGKDFGIVQKTAKLLKKLLEQLELTPFVMTTGSRGLHIIVPLNRKHTFNFVRTFARNVAQILVSQNPKTLTLEIRKEKRGKKIFIDTFRNAFAQTGVAPYAIRPKEEAPVATPLDWSEATSRTMRPDKYTIKTIFRRLGQKGDPWKNFTKHASALKKPRKILDSMLRDLSIK